VTIDSIYVFLKTLFTRKVPLTVPPLHLAWCQVFVALLRLCALNILAERGIGDWRRWGDGGEGETGRGGDGEMGERGRFPCFFFASADIEVVGAIAFW